MPVCVVCAIFIGIGLLPTNENGVVSYGKVPEYIELYYIQAIVTIVMIIMLGTLIYVVAEKKLDYMKIASAMTAVAVVICMTSSIVYGVSQGTDNTDYINRAINGGDSINMDKLESGSENYNADNNFYRIDTSENVDNWCMFWKLSSMRCFHSVVSTSIMDFYSSIGQTRDVASRMETKVYPLRSLFSVKYYFNELTESERKVSQKYRSLKLLQISTALNMLILRMVSTFTKTNIMYQWASLMITTALTATFRRLQR